jgi:hypothetical protein
MKSEGRSDRSSQVPSFIWIILMIFMIAGCASTAPNGEPIPMDNQSAIEEKWGIKVLSVRLTAASHMLDFTYRITDSEKASSLVRKQVKPYLIDQATGTRLSVPMTKLGAMRQTAVLPEADRNYRILFGNPGLVKAGSKVTVVIGDMKVENLVVE